MLWKKYQLKFFAVIGLLVFIGGGLADFFPAWVRFGCIIVGVIVFSVASIMDGVPALKEDVKHFFVSLKNKETRTSYLLWFWNNRKDIPKKFVSGGQRAFCMWASLALLILSLVFFIAGTNLFWYFGCIVLSLLFIIFL